MNRKALLLSGSLGAGHEMHARACATSLTARGWDTQTLDAMQLLGPRGGSAGEAVFRTMLATPGLFDAFHFAALRPGSRLALLADAGARRQVVPRLLLPLSLSYDHRVIDGAAAARFTRFLAELLENPLVMLLKS